MQCLQTVKVVMGYSSADERERVKPRLFVLAHSNDNCEICVGDVDPIYNVHGRRVKTT